MQKTYAEIIDETLAAGYTDLHRAKDIGTTYCYYINPRNGLSCAVGRCCEVPEDTWTGSWTTLRVSGEIQTPEQREARLLPEYRGHSAFFWMDLQGLHDGDEYWDAFGLSETGKRHVEALRKKWCHLDSTN